MESFVTVSLSMRLRLLFHGMTPIETDIETASRFENAFKSRAISKLYGFNGKRSKKAKPHQFESGYVFWREIGWLARNKQI